MQKYDRQIRLWGSTGQSRLEKSKIFIKGDSLALQEVAKNLKLAGTSFTNDANNADLVFCCRNFQQFLHLDVPIIIVDSNGFKGSVAIEFRKPLCVLEPHPSLNLFDLRFDCWPELKMFVDSFHLDQLDNEMHSHVPAYILLCIALRDGAITDLQQLKLKLQTLQRFENEENFLEARKIAFRVFFPKIPQNVFQLFDDYKTLEESIKTEEFWRHVKALETFVLKHNCLPVSGEIMDMHSLPQHFQTLKRIFKEKYLTDLNEFKTILGFESTMTETFCKNSRFLRAILPPQRGKSQKLEFGEGEEILAVSSIIGGVASQEGLKILLKQFTPCLFVKYDGKLVGE